MLQNARVKAFIFFELRESQQGGVKITPIPHTHTHTHTHTYTKITIKKQNTNLLPK